MRVLVFGDSIAQGFFDTENGGWVTLLSTGLQQRTLASGLREYNSVFNLSISGENTTEICSRFETEISQRLSSSHKNIVVFAGGINDSKTVISTNDFFVPIDQTAANVQTFLEKAKNVTEHIFVVGLSRVNDVLTKEYNSDCFQNSDIARYDERIQKVVKDFGATYIVISDLLSSEHLADGLHPNAEGHRLIYERVKDALEAKGIL